MKKLLMMLFVASSGIVIAQNQISTPVGQSLKIATDTMVVNGHLKINGKSLFLDNYRFLSYKKYATTSDLNTFIGPNSGNLATTGRWNTFVGDNTGTNNTTGVSNTFVGSLAGNSNSSARSNVFVGHRSGIVTTIGSYNAFLGYDTGGLNVSGASNTYIGSQAGSYNSTGSNNTYLGRAAGQFNTTGNDNTMIGIAAGAGNVGSGNVFIGNYAGSGETSANNKLYLANSNTSTPIILGDFSTGKLGFSTANYPTSITASPIGGGSPVTVTTTNYKLFVKGGILTEALTVAGGWADYVFEKGYRLKPLSEVESFIEKNGHLPNVPSARNIELGGINVGDIARIQQEKIEELTLYVIELEKKSLSQDAAIKEQKSEINELRSMMEQLLKGSK